MSTPTRRDAVENRAGILDAATAAIGHDPRASIDTIARRAGLSRRALYGHFDDRNAIVREVIAAGAARFNAIADRVDDADSRVALARLASELWREAAHVQAAAALALDDAHLAETSDALAPLRRRIDQIVRRGQEAESCGRTFPPRPSPACSKRRPHGRRASGCRLGDGPLDRGVRGPGHRGSVVDRGARPAGTAPRPGGAVRVVLNAVAKGRAHSALPETSTSYETGRATLVVAETEKRPRCWAWWHPVA